MNEREEVDGKLLRQLEESAEANPDDSSLRFDLGVYLWEKGGDEKEIKEKAAEHFVVSAKLNPENAAAFKYLGDYYSRVTFDSNRAAKCYQRAVALNPNDSDSGEALCDLLDRGGKESLEIALCRDASEKSPKAFWAFRRLGYLKLHQNKWSEAVQSLQHAIRGYPTVADLWEALGLAYQRLGMFTASIKAYGRAIELDDTRVFALVESANIFLMLGSYKKGVEHFQQALKILPKNVSALYGLASGLLGWSKECINLGAFRWGATLLEDACKVAEASAELAGNMSCIWKLHGDIQLMYARSFPWSEEVESLEFDLEILSNSIHSWKNTCYSAASSAKNSYQRALHLAPWQANIYSDIAITTDLISNLNDNSATTNTCQLPEKLALGALLLECENTEFWVALGCLSHHSALRQHALIRGLQLDVSFSSAWAYLGQLYRESDEMILAKQAFDSARSIDPSLALPWAGSADSYAWESISDEAFESCLRAAQILPLAEFQIGLAKLALPSGNLSSPQVFVAIKQAVERAPHYPESHNLHGLVCEARFNYHAAVASYKVARSMISVSLDNYAKSQVQDISINLARSFSMAGDFRHAVRECEDLKKKGMLDAEGLQVYAFSLWKIGENDLALSVARDLGARISTMEKPFVALYVSFICRLLYEVSGLDSAITSIQKMPKEFFESSKISFIVSAIHSLDKSDRLQSIVSSTRNFLTSPEDISAMHYVIAIGKLIKSGSGNSLGFEKGVAHLRKALHMYPYSNPLRSLLGYLLLSSEETNDCAIASRCSLIDASEHSKKEGLRSALEILGGAAVACNVIGNTAPKFSFSTCHCQCLNGPVAVRELQKCLHQEPWNRSSRYLLILNIFQKAREERFPHQLCTVLERLISIALSDNIYSEKDTSFQYEKFQLLLCASEINLQNGDIDACINNAKQTSELLLPDGYLFFGHLQLCRAYALEGNVRNLQDEYERCLQLKTHCNIGWICLKLIESQFEVQTDSSTLGLSLEECSRERKNSWEQWMAVNTLALGLVSMRKEDLFSAEKFLAQACSLTGSESCLLLCHGATCMELARRFKDSQFLQLAVKSLNKAKASSLVPLPIVSLLLAQAQGSLGAKDKWEKNLRLEWFSWPPEMRPAELFFQMHLLAKKTKDGSESESETEWGIEYCQSPEKWVLRAIHTNPSCSRYWNVLPKLMQWVGT